MLLTGRTAREFPSTNQKHYPRSWYASSLSQATEEADVRKTVCVYTTWDNAFHVGKLFAVKTKIQSLSVTIIAVFYWIYHLTLSLLDRTLIVPKTSVTFLKAGRFKIVFTCDYFNLNVVVSGKFIIMWIELSYHINTEFCPSLCCNCVFFANQLINETDRLNVSFQVQW